MFGGRVGRIAAMATIALLAGCGFRKEGLGDDNCLEDCSPSTDAGPDVVANDGDAPPDDAPPPPGTTVEGDFVGAVVSGSATGIELHGSIHWSSAVNGSNAGITLEGTLE
jgi:hypothetical protein